MGAKSLDQVLGAVVLIGIINAVKPTVAHVFPEALFSGPGLIQPITGNQGTYTKITASRETARLVAYGSPAQKRGLKGVAEVPVVLMHSFEFITLKPNVLIQLRQHDKPEVQRKGEMEVARHAANSRARSENLRTAAIHSAISQGKIWFNSAGQILASSSGAAYTIDYGIPSGNQGQLDVFGNGAIISAGWSTAGTDIVGQLAAIKAAAVKLTGYTLKHAIYGKNILGYLLGNTGLTKVIQGNPVLASAFAQNKIPDNFLDLNWWSGQEAYFIDVNGTAQTWVGDDTVIFLPEISPEWYGILEGSYLIPTTIGDILGDGNQALNTITEAQGMFAYAKVTDNPVGIEFYNGDTFLPVIKVPAAVFIADVTP